MEQKLYDIREIVKCFQFRGPLLDIRPFGSGHINDTFKISIHQGGSPIEYILQRINHTIFPNVAGMMQNIMRVTQYMRKKLLEIPGSDFSREALRVVLTQDNKPFYVDSDNNYWRAYVCIERSISYDSIQKPKQAYEAAKIFGIFQKLLQDFPNDPPLVEVLPNFHNTPRRFLQLHQAINEDTEHRVCMVQEELDFILQREKHADVVINYLENGALPFRVTHNDTKINNVMFDMDNDTGLCVVDLDTVMLGSSLYDFGDQVRTTTATSLEDEKDLTKVQFRIDLFDALARGFLEQTREFLVPKEIELLAFSGRLITMEIAVRFLTDYLKGDVYFKTKYAEHNLVRTRTQLEMLRQMEAQKDEMEKIILKYR
ncbi:MAG: aminoglycoside phosphotransferase family protein [Lentisphaeria bacterium]